MATTLAQLIEENPKAAAGSSRTSAPYSEMERRRKRLTGICRASVSQSPHRIRRNVEHANDQYRIFIDPIKNPMLAKAPAAKAKTTGIIDLAGFGILAQEAESFDQSGVISIARNFAMYRSSVGENVKQIGVRGNA